MRIGRTSTICLLSISAAYAVAFVACGGGETSGDTSTGTGTNTTGTNTTGNTTIVITGTGAGGAGGGTTGGTGGSGGMLEAIFVDRELDDGQRRKSPRRIGFRHGRNGSAGAA